MSQTPASPSRRSVARMPGDRPNARGEATRQRILAEAERLFAERGIEAVPLRDIGIAAGQRNHAVVQYHFGDRLQLIHEILEFRGGASDMHRESIVADLMFDDSPPKVADIVGAFVRPLAIHFEQDNHYLAFLSRYITEEGGYEGLGDRGTHVGAAVGTLRTLLGRLVADVPEPVLDERWWVTLTSAVHALARYQSAQRKREQLPARVDVLLDDLIAYLSAGIVAPVVARDPRATVVAGNPRDDGDTLLSGSGSEMSHEL